MITREINNDDFSMMMTITVAITIFIITVIIINKNDFNQFTIENDFIFKRSVIIFSTINKINK